MTQTMGVPEPELEALEIDLLLEGLFRRYGYDFRDYARASLRRRIGNIVQAEGLTGVAGLQEKVLRDPACLERFLLALSVNVTAMFRDPGFFLTFRQQVVPLLRTYSFLRLWCAGCSTGEEVYSLAILLEEEGLYDRCRIYATDMNEAVLHRAKEGIFPLSLMQDYTRNYLKAGGKAAFPDYYTAAYDRVLFSPALKRQILFSQHNLVTDGSFNEFHAILCRNVLIYFNRALQERVHRLLYDSLGAWGILGLGDKETIRFTPHEREYEELPGGERIYRKVR